MRTIEWKVVLSEDDSKIAIMESAQGFLQDKIESQLIIIGLLEDIKQKHLETLKTLYNKKLK